MTSSVMGPGLGLTIVQFWKKGLNPSLDRAQSKTWKSSLYTPEVNTHEFPAGFEGLLSERKLSLKYAILELNFDKVEIIDSNIAEPLATS